MCSGWNPKNFSFLQRCVFLFWQTSLPTTAPHHARGMATAGGRKWTKPASWAEFLFVRRRILPNVHLENSQPSHIIVLLCYLCAWPSVWAG